MNIFQGKTVYGQPWEVTNIRSLEADEISQVSSAEVVMSKNFPDQKSVCFHMKAGGNVFIPLSRDSSIGVGESCNLLKAKVLTLSRQGDADIERIQL